MTTKPFHFLQKSMLLTGVVLLGSGAAAGVATPALAQEAQPIQSDQSEAGSVITDVVVTARRRDERLQDVPISITALSGDQLEARGVEQVSDITRVIPGVFAAPGGSRGTNSPVFSLRGQVNQDANLTADPSVGLYFAEVPWARPQGANSAVFDLQAVEVLKGPQGTLFGRNSTAGAILLTPHAPTDQLEGMLQVGAGSYNQLGAQGILNIPLADGVALRIAGKYERRDGYLTNVVSGQRLNDVNNQALRASLRLNPSAGVTSTFIASYYRSSTNGDGQKLIGISPAPISPGLAGFYARLPGALQQTNALGRYEILSSFAPSVANQPVLGVPQVFLTSQFDTVETYGIQNITSIELGELGPLGAVTVRNIFGYRHEADGSTYETAATPFLSAQVRSRQTSEQISEELQLQGRSGAVNYIIGGFYFRETGTSFQEQYAVQPLFSLQDSDIVNTSYSAFAHATVDLSQLITPGLGIAAGVRLTHDRRFLLNRNRRQIQPGVVAVPTFVCRLTGATTTDGATCGVPSSVSFTEPTFSIGLNYRLVDRTLIYATVSSGYRSGGFTAGAQNAVAAAPYRPETILNYEFGVKSDFHLGSAPARFNSTVFYTDYSDIQLATSILQPSGGSIFVATINAAKAQIFGLETELVVRPTPRTELSLGYTYIAPRYNRFGDLYREPTNGVIYPIDVSDSRFLQVSRHSLSVNLVYHLPVSPRVGEISLQANFYYRSSFTTSQAINTANCAVPGNPNPAAIYVGCYPRAGRLPGHSVLNFQINWRNMLGNPRLESAAFVTNVTNEYYFTGASNALNVIGTNSAFIGAPRMFGASLTYHLQ